VTGDEKWIYFQNPKCKKSWVDLAQLSTFCSRPLRTEDDAVRLVGSGGCHLLRAVDETVNAHRYLQQLIKLHRALREKRPHYRKRHADFPPRQRTIAHVNNGPKLLGDSTGKCYPIPLTHQTWHLPTMTCFRRWATR